MLSVLGRSCMKDISKGIGCGMQVFCLGVIVQINLLNKSKNFYELTEELIMDFH